MTPDGSLKDIHISISTEDHYLSAYPDVRDAVATGRITSGLEHFRRWGRAGRAAIRDRRRTGADGAGSAGPGRCCLVGQPGSSRRLGTGWRIRWCAPGVQFALPSGGDPCDGQLWQVKTAAARARGKAAAWARRLTRLRLRAELERGSAAQGIITEIDAERHCPGRHRRGEAAGGDGGTGLACAITSPTSTTKWTAFRVARTSYSLTPPSTMSRNWRSCFAAVADMLKPVESSTSTSSWDPPGPSGPTRRSRRSTTSSNLFHPGCAACRRASRVRYRPGPAWPT